MPLSWCQQEVVEDQHRFKVVIAGRRWGKTHLAIRELCYHARIPNREVWYIAPTYRQAKQIVWRKLKHKLQDQKWTAKINEAELTIILKNGSIISLKGADNADSLRGVGLDFMVMDEFADIDPEAWYEVLRPTLADKQGGALFIGTPKGVANWAHDLYQMPTEFPESWSSFTYTTIDGGNVPEEEIDAARQDLDERTFRQEFLATFETYAGRIYYAFDRKENVITGEPEANDLAILYTGWDFNIDPAAWYEVLRPTLADKQGGALFIGTPKGVANWAHDLYQMPTEFPESWSSFTYTTIDGGNVPEEEIDAARQDLDERTFRQEFLATFETYAGRIYYAFNRKENVITGEPEASDLSILYTGWDFNIDPMSVVIAIRKGDTLCVIDEIRMFSSNTQEAVDEIKARYPKSKIWAFPDPASRQRKTSAGGTTDLTILQNAGFVVKVPHSHTPVRDRINAVNSRLCDSTGVKHLFLLPSCKYTIEGLERHTYKEGTVQPDKESGYDHMMDALGYMIDYLFPIKRDTGHIPQPTTWGHQIKGASPTMNYNLRNNIHAK